MISYHCSVILSLFINFYLFCNYLSRLYLSLFVYDCLLGELCAHLFEFIWGRTITWTELLYVFPYSLWCFINSPPFVMAPFAKHWNVTDTHFLLSKAFIFIRLEFMELIVSAHFNNVDSLKHSLGSLGSAPASSC